MRFCSCSEDFKRVDDGQRGEANPRQLGLTVTLTLNLGNYDGADARQLDPGAQPGHGRL